MVNLSFFIHQESNEVLISQIHVNNHRGYYDPRTSSITPTSAACMVGMALVSSTHNDKDKLLWCNLLVRSYCDEQD